MNDTIDAQEFAYHVLGQWPDKPTQRNVMDNEDLLALFAGCITEQNEANVAACLVAADWLEEHGYEHEADLLRTVDPTRPVPCWVKKHEMICKKRDYEPTTFESDRERFYSASQTRVDTVVYRSLSWAYRQSPDITVFGDQWRWELIEITVIIESGIVRKATRDRIISSANLVEFFRVAGSDKPSSRSDYILAKRLNVIRRDNGKMDTIWPEPFKIPFRQHLLQITLV